VYVNGKKILTNTNTLGAWSLSAAQKPPGGPANQVGGHPLCRQGSKFSNHTARWSFSLSIYFLQIPHE